MLRTFCFIILFGLLAPVHAQEDRTAPPPPLPEDPADELPEPEVKIIHREDRIVEEVSVNGRSILGKGLYLAAILARLDSPCWINFAFSGPNSTS